LVKINRQLTLLEYERVVRYYFNDYLIGPYTFDGNVNDKNFLAFLRNELSELLKDVD